MRSFDLEPSSTWESGLTPADVAEITHRSEHMSYDQIENRIRHLRKIIDLTEADVSESLDQDQGAEKRIKNRRKIIELRNILVRERWSRLMIKHPDIIGAITKALSPLSSRTKRGGPPVKERPR